MEKTGKYKFLAEPFHCDVDGRLLIGHLGNHLLNAADYHSRERGFGMDYLGPMHKAWVLSRLAVELTDTPVAYDELTVETWVEGAMRYFTTRDFAVRAADGHAYGFGRSVWALIDTATRQPTDILAIRGGSVADYIETGRECPAGRNARVRPAATHTVERRVEMQYSDVDVNGHVNSVKYIEHALDLLPISYHRAHRLRRIEVAYVAEAHAGDTLTYLLDRVGESEEYNFFIVKGDGKDKCCVNVAHGKFFFA